jgi:hypothetical protein
MSGTSAPLLFGTAIGGTQCPLPAALREMALDGFAEPDPLDEAPAPTLEEYQVQVHELTLQYHDNRTPLLAEGDHVVVATVEYKDVETDFEALAAFEAFGVSATREVALSSMPPDDGVSISSYAHDGQRRLISYAEVEDDLMACESRISYFFPAMHRKQILKVQTSDQICSVFPFDHAQGLSDDDIRDCMQKDEFFAALEASPGL